MEQIIQMLITQSAIWAPSLVSIIGIIVGVISYGTKIKEALAEVKGATVELKDEQSIKELINSLKAAQGENAELRHQNQLILEQLTKVKNYDTIKSMMNQEATNEDGTINSDKEI